LDDFLDFIEDVENLFELRVVVKELSVIFYYVGLVL